jgi:hypothetical protein
VEECEIKVKKYEYDSKEENNVEKREGMEVKERKVR